ncbi:hypothetical protein [Streptomyces sp. MA15]|uniref:poly(ethylene terephthalate) hydrolase family protein n=1 Tax=Streptomyces sp. MA15 TaxID=3055061 RepID=UPI0025AFC2C0|nr:hypothetical protein [Streptomyces sp. MA15]MDN3267270.1 hypothetical protein [Streptomyces sp. MA15]
MSHVSGRLRLCGAAAVGVMALGTAGVTTAPASAATPVYSEDFSDGLGTFTASGSVRTGTYGARLSGSLSSDSSIVSAPIDPTGYDDLTLSYTRVASGLDLGETFTVAYSVGGGPFTTLESARTAAGAVSFPLPDSAENGDLRLRFSLDANSLLETLTVDDVLIEAEDGGGPTDPPTGSLPPVDDVTEPGPYAVTVDESAGPDDDGWLVYPADAGRDGVDHPVFVWGPGAGSDPADYEDMLRLWASHGFVVYSEVSSSNGAYMVDALDWLEDRNASPAGPLYGDLDLSEVAFGGHSRGSLGTFDVADEPRLETTVHVAGGSFDGNGPDSLRNPALYIGGDEDFATANMERDYAGTDVPVWFTVLDDTDHILATRNGRHVITAWLRWHLADEEFRRTQDFLSPGCAFCGLGDVRYKNW